MQKRNFIELADVIRQHNHECEGTFKDGFTPEQISLLADFCRRQNPKFNRERWLAYIAGTCGPNGGKRRARKVKVCVAWTGTTPQFEERTC